MPPKTEIITTFSLSGGQGKTLTTFMLGVKAAKQGIPTLIIDCDPQATLTDICGIECQNSPTLYEVFDKERRFNVEDAVYPVPGRPNLFIIPADNSLGDRDNELRQSPNCGIQLKLRLAPIVDDFKLIVIDTSPSRNLLAMAAVGAANRMLIPIEATAKGNQALPRTWGLVEECIEADSFRGEILGLIPFRAKMAGRSLCHEGRDSIAAMEMFLDRQSLVKSMGIGGKDLILPMVVESDVYKRVYSRGQTPAEVDPKAAPLENSFDVILQKLGLVREAVAV